MSNGDVYCLGEELPQARLGSRTIGGGAGEYMTVTTTSADSWHPYPAATDNTGWYPLNWGYSPRYETKWAINDFGKLAPLKNEEVEEMRGLFQVYVVDPEEGELLYQGTAIASSAKNAEFKVLSRVLAIKLGEFELDDLDVIVVRLGDVRAVEKIAKVQVVE